MDSVGGCKWVDGKSCCGWWVVGGKEEVEVVGWWQSKVKGASRVVQSSSACASLVKRT